MNRVLAIAGLTLRAAVRSKVFALLIILVGAGIVGLPLIMKSDGTLSGQVQLFLHYTLGLTVILLSVTATWAGAGAVSLEVEGRQMQLVVTKPVHALEIWLGKWLGLMTVNVILLMLAGGVIFGLLCWTTRPARLSRAEQVALREEILVARSEILPESKASIPPGAPGGGAVSSGKTERWEFKLPDRVHAGVPVYGAESAIYLQFRFVTSRPDYPTPMAGLWLVGDDNEPDRYRHMISAMPNKTYAFKIPVSAGRRRLTVAYVNREEKAPATALFDPGDGVKLLVRESGFEANYVRALLMALARLAFFSALGLTAGVLFSFPVAAFVSLAFLLVAGFNQWIKQVATGGLILQAGAEPGRPTMVFNVVVQEVVVVLNLMMPPLSHLDPLEFLPNGIFIPWGLVGRAWMVLVGIYSGFLALMGAWLFSRREIGLPTT